MYSGAPKEYEVNKTYTGEENSILFDRTTRTGRDGSGLFEIVEGELPDDGFDQMSGMDVTILEKAASPENENKFVYKVRIGGAAIIGSKSPEQVSKMIEEQLAENKVVKGIVFERGLDPAAPKLYTGEDAEGNVFILDIGDGPKDLPKTFTGDAYVTYRAEDENGKSRYFAKYLPSHAS